VVGECSFGKPDLMISNHLAWELFQKISGQVIVAGMGDILGIRFEAIAFILDFYEIYDSETRHDVFEKILAIDSVRIKFRNQDLIKNKSVNKK